MMPTTAKRLLKDVGANSNSQTFSLKDFPKVVKPEFLELFEEFLGSRYYDILSELNDDPYVTKLNVIHGFMSYTMNYTSLLFKSPYNLNKISAYGLLEAIKAHRKPHIEKFTRWNILQEFQLLDVRVKLTPSFYDKELGYLHKFDCYIEYHFGLAKKYKLVFDKNEGRNVQKANTVTEALYRLKPYMFKREIPKELFPKRNFNQDRFPLLNDVRVKPTRAFAELDKDAYAHLSGRNSILIRFNVKDLADATLFLGREPKSTMIKRIEKSASTLF